MIVARLTDGTRSFCTKQFLDAASFEVAVENALRDSAGLMSWDSHQIGWCESCQHAYELPGVKHGRRGYCCDECADEHNELINVKHLEFLQNVLCVEMVEVR